MVLAKRSNLVLLTQRLALFIAAEAHILRWQEGWETLRSVEESLQMCIPKTMAPGRVARVSQKGYASNLGYAGITRRF